MWIWNTGDPDPDPGDPNTCGSGTLVSLQIRSLRSNSISVRLSDFNPFPFTQETRGS